MNKTARSWIMGILVCLGNLLVSHPGPGRGGGSGTGQPLCPVCRADGWRFRESAFEKNGEEQRPMASTTKIMTCILVLESGRQEETARTSAYAASMPRSIWEREREKVIRSRICSTD